MLNFIFPSLCLHCKTRVESKRLFCEGCVPFFELIDPKMRCPHCFVESHRRGPCKACIEKKNYHLNSLCVLEYLGPVTSLIAKLKYGRTPYLAKTVASFMAIQLFRSKWPKPDLIVPIPPRLWFQGANHAELIAKALGTILERPVKKIIGREVGDLPGTCTHFYLKKPVIDQTILIVDDVMFSGTTVNHMANALLEGSPKKIYALTFAYQNHQA